MWERQIKNEYGEIQEIYRSERDASDALLPDPGWLVYNSYNSAGLEVKYIVESLNKRNAQAFENAQLVGSCVNPLELNDQFITDSFGDAIHELIIRMFDPDTVNEPTLTMYIKDRYSGEAEVTAEVPTTTRNTIRLIVDDAMRRRNIELESVLDTYSKENDLMREFIYYNHAKDIYNMFAEERRSKR